VLPFGCGIPLHSGDRILTVADDATIAALAGHTACRTSTMCRFIFARNAWSIHLPRAAETPIGQWSEGRASRLDSTRTSAQVCSKQNDILSDTAELRGIQLANKTEVAQPFVMRRFLNMAF
jgi:hypothetical protein